MFLIKTQSIFFNPINIYLEVFDKKVFRKLFFYYFYNIEVRVNFVFHLRNKKYFSYFFKNNIVASIFRFFKVKKKRLTVIRAPFVYKKSKEQFERRTYKCVIQTHFLDLLIFKAILQNKVFQNYDIKYKLKSKEYGQLIF